MLQRKRVGFAIVAGVMATLSLVSHAAELPKATVEILRQTRLNAEILVGLDQELAVPHEMMEAARKEGNLTMIGSWDPKDFRKLSAPFMERYPFIKIKYNYGRAFNERAIKPLIAFKEGRYITDIITGFGGARRLYFEANALEDLRPLPGFKNPIVGNDPGGGWMVFRNRYWCMAYNTSLIKEADLPKAWDDILVTPSLHNGRLGAASRPQLWLLPLWNEKGKSWTDTYIEKFFSVVRPQIRKEGLSALVTLVVAGEVPIGLPADPARVKAYLDKGAPIGFHCPDLVPRAVSQIGILRGAPNTNAAKIWTNWMVSKEGQVAQFHAEGTSPSHRELQRPELLPFADKVLGRKHIDEDETKLNELNESWAKQWKKAGIRK